MRQVVNLFFRATDRNLLSKRPMIFFLLHTAVRTGGREPAQGEFTRMEWFVRSADGSVNHEPSGDKSHGGGGGRAKWAFCVLGAWYGWAMVLHRHESVVGCK